MKIVIIGSVFESIGIEYISSILKLRGHYVKLLIDSQSLNSYFSIPFIKRKYEKNEYLIKQIKEYKPDLVISSIYSDTRKETYRITKAIKSESNSIIVIGGVHATSNPEEVIAKKFVDFVVIGEGEFALVELIDAIKRNKDIKDVPNLCYRKKNQIIKTLNF